MTNVYSYPENNTQLESGKSMFFQLTQTYLANISCDRASHPNLPIGITYKIMKAFLFTTAPKETNVGDAITDFLAMQTDHGEK